MIEDQRKSINTKFDMALQYTKNFSDLLSKISTEKKKNTSRVLKTNEIQENTTLEFDNGWQYIGSHIEGKFDGYGCLCQHGKEIYAGWFKLGKMHERGKMANHEAFKDMIEIEDWVWYQGQFEEGKVNGVGSLIL